jgi:hypothetical protein
MTNKGLRMELLLWQEQEPASKTAHNLKSSTQVYLAPLNCTRGAEGHPVAIYLKNDGEDQTMIPKEFVRYSPRIGRSLKTFLATPINSESIWDSVSEKFLEPKQRRIVYVKQLSNHPDTRLTYRPRRFSITYPSNLCSILEVRLHSGLAGWEGREPGECAIWLDSVDEAAMIIFNYWYKMINIVFAILLRSLPDDSACVDIAASVVGESISAETVSELSNLFKEQMRRGLRKTDRISRLLATGHSISIKVIPRAVSREKQFLVEVSINHFGQLPWLALHKETALEHLDEQENKIIDCLKLYTAMHPSSFDRLVV